MAVVVILLGFGLFSALLPIAECPACNGSGYLSRMKMEEEIKSEEAEEPLQPGYVIDPVKTWDCPHCAEGKATLLTKWRLPERDRRNPYGE